MISFIIVNYNSKDMTHKLMNYIINSVESENYEIILVDNASTDGSKEFFESITTGTERFRYIYNNANLGFAKANDIGEKNATGDILVFINPDIEIHQKGFDKFIVHNLKDEIGVLAPRIVYPDGSTQPNCGGFSTFSTYLFHTLRLGCYIRKLKIGTKLYKLSDKIPALNKTVVGKYLRNFNVDDQRRRECDWVSGACMIIRKELFEEVGGFDENFFMYVEDEELCRRIKTLGYKICVISDFCLIHLEGGTQKKELKILSLPSRERYKSDIYYFFKYHGFFSALFLKFFFVSVQLISCLMYLIKLDFSIAKDRLKFAADLLSYTFNENGIAVVGYYGSGNIGDEFILHALLEKHKKNKNIFFVLSGDPIATKDLHKVHSYNKKNLFGVLYTFLSSQQLIIGGGGLFSQANASTYLYCSFLVRLYKLFGKRVCVSRVGLSKGVLSSFKNRFLLSQILKYSDSFSVRDSSSYNEILMYFPKLRCKIKIEDDYVIEFMKHVNTKKFSPKKQIGLSLRKINGFDYKKIIDFIKSYGSKGYLIKFYIFFKKEGDLDIANEIIKEINYSNCVIEDFSNVQGNLFDYVLSSIAENEIFISMRLYPLILAYYLGIECKSVSCTSKLQDFSGKNKIEEL